MEKYSRSLYLSLLMSSSNRKTDEFLEKLILDIKAFVLLQGSDAELKSRVEQRLVASQDDSVKRFVGALRTGAKPQAGRLLGIALGELVVASLLVFAGTVALVPTVVGINTPAGLVQYFTETVLGRVAASPLAPYVGVLEYVVGATLILSAFYSLRQAALSLKEMGLSIEPGEA
jgi:hypothetical protein